MRNVLCAALAALAVAAPAAAQEPRTEAPAPPTEPRAVDPVVITATKVETTAAQIGAAVTVIPGDDLATANPPDLGEALRTVPGVDVQRSGSLGKTTSIRIRGAGPQQVQVLVDGLRVKSPTLGQADLAEYPPDAVERIEIIRGPQSTLYGADAIGGVVNIITRKGQGRPSGFVHLEGGSYDTFRQRAGFQGAWGGFNVNLWGSRWETGGQFDNDDAEQTSVAGRVGYDFPWRGELSVSGRYTETEMGLPIQTTIPPPTTFDPNQRQDLETFLFTIAYRQPVTRWWDVSARYGQWANDSVFRDAPPPDDDFPLVSRIETRRREAELINAFHLARWTTLTAGLEHRYELGRSRGEFRKEIDTLAAFVQDELRFFDRLFLTGSVRWEDSDAFESALTSRVAASFLVRETGTRLRASWGEGFRAPTINDLAFPGFGNPDLRPERSESWDAGFDQELWQRRVRFGATYFHNHFEDLIQFAVVPVSPAAPFGFLPINVGRARTRGVEAYLELEPLDWLLVWGNYTNTSTRDLETGQRLRRFPRHRWNAGVTVTPHPRLDLWAQALVVSRQFEGPGVGHNPGYHRIDIGGTWRMLGRVGVMERLELTARIENLTDARYAEVFGIPALGFNALVGLRARFE